MRRTCVICSHRKRAAIDEKLLRGIPQAQIRHDYRVSPHCISRHAENHLRAIIEQAKEIAGIVKLTDNGAVHRAGGRPVGEIGRAHV